MSRRALAALQGIAIALCWAVFLESSFLLQRSLGAGFALPVLPALQRVAETAACVVLVALVVGWAWTRVSPSRRVSAVAVYAAAGVAFCFWLGIVSWVLVPEDESIRLSTDPLMQRWKSALLATALYPILAFGLARLLESTWAKRVPPVVAVLGVAALAATGPSENAQGTRPDVFLFSVDTLRADHLGCYGYPLPTSPALDELCAESVVFERAMAPAPSTIPSYVSMMTGLWQHEHGVFSNYEKAGEGLVTVAERLRDAGYTTAAILEGSFPGTFSNLDQGFDFVIQRGITAQSITWSPAEALRSVYWAVRSFTGERLHWDVSVTTEAAERWLNEMRHQHPLFVHFYWPYPHDPYTPPQRYQDTLPKPAADPEVADAVGRYDAEVLYTDRQLAQLLGALRELGRYEDAWIVFTADHGEELGRVVASENGTQARFFGHNLYLYDSSIHVPLIARPPLDASIEPRREERVISITALAPTLTEMAGLSPLPKQMPPLPLHANDAYSADAFSITRSSLKPVHLVSIRTRNWRLVETRKPKYDLELYREDDVDESDNLAGREPEVVESLLERLRASAPRTGEGEVRTPELSDRERERLEALGYLM